MLWYIMLSATPSARRTTLRFTCGERKIWSTITKSQNIMNMIVVQDNKKTLEVL